MDVGSRLIVNSTPRLAKLVSSKYSNMDGRQVVEDLAESHCLDKSLTFVQGLHHSVANIVISKELSWHYDLPQRVDASQVESVSVSRDGVTMRMCLEENKRMAMAGCILLNDKEGNALHTIYVGASPETGNGYFNQMMDFELSSLKKQLPDVSIYQGLADGLADNWTYLEQVSTIQTLDFYHAALHLGNFAKCIEDSQGMIGHTSSQKWQENVREDWKNKPKGVEDQLQEMKKMLEAISCEKIRTAAQGEIKYFENQKHRMAYKEVADIGLPIGSGKVEAACKTLVNQRFDHSGMRWTKQGADEVFATRQLKQTKGRWEQWWRKFMRYNPN